MRRRGALWIVVLASGCSKTAAPPPVVDAGPSAPSTTSVAAAPPVSSAHALASAAPASSSAASSSHGVPKVLSTMRSKTATVETTMETDEPDAEDATRTYRTWFSENGRTQLLATHAFMGEPLVPNESQVTTRFVGDRIEYFFDGQGCPSNWVGLYEAEFTASPLALARERVDSWNRAVECTATREEWSWQDFTGRVTHECTAGKSCAVHEAVMIPDVTLPDAYGAADWACHRIDGCAAMVDGTKGHGFVTFGARRERDPVMRAVIAGRWLFVQIDGELPGAREDDRHWVSEDHVEVWMGQTPLMGDCAETSLAVQWGVRIADAHVFAGVGNPVLLRAERASCGPSTVVLRVALPEKRDALTVAYSAGAEHKQRLLMATSQLKYGDGASLGSIKKIDPKRAVCVVKGEGLAPKMTPVASDAPMASFD